MIVVATLVILTTLALGFFVISLTKLLRTSSVKYAKKDKQIILRHDFIKLTNFYVIIWLMLAIIAGIHTFEPAPSDKVIFIALATSLFLLWWWDKGLEKDL